MDINHNQSRLLFISLYESDYSRSAVLLSGLKSASFHQLTGSLMDNAVRIRRIVKSDPELQAIVVMSPSHYLSISARLFSDKKVVLDAGWPLSDSSRLRIRGIRGIITLLKDYCLDFISFQASHIVVVESQAQKIRVQRNFLLHQKKIHVIYTSLDEKKFDSSRGAKKEIGGDIRLMMDTSKKVVLFRGKNNPESGLELLALASSSISSAIQLVVVSSNLSKNITFDNSAILIDRFLSPAELQEVYRLSTLVIGQLGNTSRQQWTIPHKFFESAFFKVPYLSKSSKAIGEVSVSPPDLVVSKNIGPKDLAEQINSLVSKENELDKAGFNLHEDYQTTASQDISVNSFLRIINTL